MAGDVPLKWCDSPESHKVDAARSCQATTAQDSNHTMDRSGERSYISSGIG
jgi:hypothetical protein